MTWRILTVATAVALLTASRPVAETPQIQADPPILCESCAAWNTRREPFRVFGNTYYVGVTGLSSVLITSSAGHILVDGALPQSAPLIDASVRALGFRTEDIRLIVVSHEHYDHAGGVAGLQRATGATVAASAETARALEQGEPLSIDPQYGFGRETRRFPRVTRVRVISDGEMIRVNDLAITAHRTPGHAPGSTTWTWRSCEGTRCVNVVYADSLNAVSAPGFLFTRQAGLVETLRQSIAKVRDLPCDVLLSVHNANPVIDAAACRQYADTALQTLERRIAEERPLAWLTGLWR